ncbi:glutamate racemase [Flavobacteriaceae bacterium]|jgi:glutamate racemase|nr:glutamate racemase [Flavobacteriaceae bacterium]|tara:strand:+ start:584 stop:1354 length:771 start_codon:yes stop_codon:yes gene_type:complete
MNNSPIGIFDSGIGGITILNSIKNLLPNESIIYYSDNLNSPYGNKSKIEIEKLSFKNVEFLINKGCKIIVVACNTATTNSIKKLRANFNIPFIGIEPAIKPAAMKTKSGLIGVLATEGTLSSLLFGKTSSNHSLNVNIIEKNAEGLVELIEKGIFHGEKIEEILKKCLLPMIEQKIDHLVLGCTHYPILINTIKSIIPNTIKIIDNGEAVALQTKRILKKNQIENSSLELKYLFYCNGSPMSLNKILNNKFTVNKV